VDRVRAEGGKGKVPALKLPQEASEEALALLNRIYIREDLDEADRWHRRCGHISMKYLRRLNLKSLAGKKLPDTFRCESCIKGKIHRLSHKEMHLQRKAIFQSGGIHLYGSHGALRAVS
jgi:hypothetical protein